MPTIQPRVYREKRKEEIMTEVATSVANGELFI